MNGLKVVRAKIAILASGSGTTAEAVAQSTQDGRLNADIVLIITNNPNAGITDQPTIKKLKIQTQCINSKTHPSGTTRKGAMTDEESEAILQAVKKAGCDLVVLLGYMKQVRGALLDALGYNGGGPARMLNTHPGPLPETAGTYGHFTHEKVHRLYRAGKLTATGPTLHQVSAHYDEGPTVQYANEVILMPNDTPDTIEKRIREVERRVTPIGIGAYLKLLQTSKEIA